MIDIGGFERLRMSQFLDPKDITLVSDFEFECHVSIGETFGFSEWLRTIQAPKKLWSLSIDFEGFPMTQEVLSELGLPLTPGMSIDELTRRFGRYKKIWSFVDDRRTYEFLIPQQNPTYVLKCTVLNVGGLCHVVIMVQSVLDRPAFDREVIARNTKGI